MSLKYQREIHLVSDSAYYAFTTLVGAQTLGEEYCDIVQVSKNQAPSMLVINLFYHY